MGWSPVNALWIKFPIYLVRKGRIPSFLWLLWTFPLIFSVDYFLGPQQFSYTHALGRIHLNTPEECSASTFLSLCLALLWFSGPHALAPLISSDFSLDCPVAPFDWDSLAWKLFPGIKWTQSQGSVSLFLFSQSSLSISVFEITVFYILSSFWLFQMETVCVTPSS